MLLDRRAHLPIYPCYPKLSFKPHIGHQKCDTVKLAFTALRYTGVIPATYAGPGYLGSDSSKLGQHKQGVNKSLRVEPLLAFKHLLTV